MSGVLKVRLTAMWARQHRDVLHHEQLLPPPKATRDVPKFNALLATRSTLALEEMDREDHELSARKQNRGPDADTVAGKVDLRARHGGPGRARRDTGGRDDADG